MSKLNDFVVPSFSSKIKLNESLSRKIKLNDFRPRRAFFFGSFPKRRSHWVTPLESKDFKREIQAKVENTNFEQNSDANSGCVRVGPCFFRLVAKSS